MPKYILQKGNVHGSDHHRAVVTDTIPGDIPIIVSNDGFYKNLKLMKSFSQNTSDFVSAVLRPARRYTVPFRYNILKSSGGFRRLSLLHPAAQMKVADFYAECSHLICYYCRKSIASLRAPIKVGSLFFVRGPRSDTNRYKASGIDTVDLETTVSNPASYFSYKGYDRAYKFFSSPLYMRLEKRYGVMIFSDVSKCFPSIYTHTLYWAIQDVARAKENTTASSFSNHFDSLMQFMNFNETNGICVGAEISRVFAELILSEVDHFAIDILKAAGLKFYIDYEFYRYVDDCYIFGRDSKIGDQVLAALMSSLARFNLHFNDQKTVAYKRPFLTKKSRAIWDANRYINDFVEKITESNVDDLGKFLSPAAIRNQHSLIRSLLESVKASCFDQDSGYSLVAGYIVGGLTSRLTVILSDFSRARTARNIAAEAYVPTITVFLETLFFIYNVYPEVPSSLMLARAAIVSVEFIKSNAPDRLVFISEEIIRWVHNFARTLEGSLPHAANECVPLETLNLLLILGNIGNGDALAAQLVVLTCVNIDKMQYFEIVCFLFIIGKIGGHYDLRKLLFARANEVIRKSMGVQVDAQACHLLLDMLSCKYIDVEDRVSLFLDVRKSINTPIISRSSAQEVVRELEKNPWFVNWDETDLLRMIRKKELSSVY